MASRNSLYFCIIIGLLVMSLYGCMTTKNIDEKYLVITDISLMHNEENYNMLILQFKGDYAESSWGIKSIKYQIIGNTIVFNGLLALGEKGTFKCNVEIPPHIDSVKFNSRILWTRDKTR